MKLGKFRILGTPPQKKNISLKHLKLPKNHFKTNLFFVQLKHLNSTYTFGKKVEQAGAELCQTQNSAKLRAQLRSELI